MSLSFDSRLRPPLEERPAEDAEVLPAPRTAQRDVLAWVRLLWERRRWLGRVALYALLASTVIAFVIPARYESTVRLMPPDNQSSSGLAMAAAAMSNASGGLGAMAGDLLGLKSTSDVFVGILGSRTVQDKLIEQFDLKKVYWDRRMEDARRDLSEHTSISVDRKSQIITIRVSDHRPQRAAAMAQAYVDELNRLVAELSTSSARRERMFLEERLRTVNTDLESAEKEFSQFASQNAAIDVKEQGKAMVEAAATLQGQLIAAQSEYEGLKQIYTDNNVRVRALRARVGELQHQLEKLGGKGQTPEELASTSSSELYPSLRKLPLLGVTYADLFRRTKIQEAVLEILTKQYEMAKVQEAKEIPTVKVLDDPDVPEKRSFPPRIFLMLLGTLLALAGAATWIFGLQMWREADASDPRKVFAQEVLSTLAARLPRRRQRIAPVGNENGLTNPGIENPRDLGEV
ncbi:MAG: lipopolysaccharide biosynthesis protein [Acidobacteria bacterium]|nr:lipopolysaccharide biosynthesis protein [Acidobacteriota bacterium]